MDSIRIAVPGQGQSDMRMRKEIKTGKRKTGKENRSQTNAVNMHMPPMPICAVPNIGSQASEFRCPWKTISLSQYWYEEMPKTQSHRMLHRTSPASQTHLSRRMTKKFSTHVGTGCDALERSGRAKWPVQPQYLIVPRRAHKLSEQQSGSRQLVI
ncbi:hypothetical protein ACRALDRAFT_212506 [Sodiomyces alcalophilus JCM 7366]|uniref:uncharacterized protein n=1 Tax=Sodiomyces alcalophilus JCM 7366 TaxID=591952 RepID=UPI0039B3EA8E